MRPSEEELGRRRFAAYVREVTGKRPAPASSEETIATILAVPPANTNETLAPTLQGKELNEAVQEVPEPPPVTIGSTASHIQADKQFEQAAKESTKASAPIDSMAAMAADIAARTKDLSIDLHASQAALDQWVEQDRARARDQ